MSIAGAVVGAPPPLQVAAVGAALRGRALLHDAVGRADSASSAGSAELGGAWTVGDAGDAATLPTWGVSGNALYCPNLGNKNDSHLWLESSAADVVVRARITMPTAASGAIPGLLLRRVDGNNYYVLRLQPASSTITIVRSLAAARTTVLSIPFTFLDGQVLLLDVRMQGALFTTRVNGQTLKPLIDGNFVTATKHGIQQVGLADASARFRDFAVEMPMAA